MLISAPALKNLSPAPRSRRTCTLSSKRACKIASSSWRIISWLYVLAGGLVMNPMAEARGLQYPLTDTAIIPPSLRTHNRHHDGCPCNVDRSIPVSVLGMTALLTDKAGLTLAV